MRRREKRANERGLLAPISAAVLFCLSSERLVFAASPFTMPRLSWAISDNGLRSSFGWARFAWFPAWLALIKFRGEILGAAILDIFIAVLRNSGQVHPWVQLISCLRYSIEQLPIKADHQPIEIHPEPPVSNECKFSLLRWSRNEFQSQILTAPRLQFIACRLYLQPQNENLSSFLVAKSLNKSSLLHQHAAEISKRLNNRQPTCLSWYGAITSRMENFAARSAIGRQQNSKSHTLWTCPGQSGAILLTFRHANSNNFCSRHKKWSSLSCLSFAKCEMKTVEIT